MDFFFKMNGARMGNRVGTLHFIRFPTSEMDQFLQLAKSKGFATLSSTICATGGGAYKFEADFLKVFFVLSKFTPIYRLINSATLCCLGCELAFAQIGRVGIAHWRPVVHRRK